MKFNITLQEIIDKKPCYDPIEYLPENWTGTLVDILDLKDCPFEDRLWVVTWFLGDKINRLFAVYCARQAIALIKNPDLRSVNAIEVAEKFAYGKATKEELAAAWDAARDAAWPPAWDAAWPAARDAATIAARVAARDAATDAAWDATRDAAWDDFEAYLRLLIKRVGE